MNHDVINYESPIHWNFCLNRLYFLFEEFLFFSEYFTVSKSAVWHLYLRKVHLKIGADCYKSSSVMMSH